MEIHELPAVSAPDSYGDVFAIDTGSQTYKINYQALAEAILNSYAELYLYNGNKSVKDAMDAIYAAVQNRVRLDYLSNNLTTTSESHALDARQGPAIKTLIDACVKTANVKNNLTTSSAGYVLDARQGAALQSNIDATQEVTTAPTGITGVTGAKFGKIATISLTSLSGISSGTASGAVIGTLVTAYRPAAIVDFRTSLAANIRLRINTSGQLLLGEDATANITPRGSVTYITAS